MVVDLNNIKDILAEEAIKAATESGKQALVRFIKDTALPAVQKVAAEYVATITEHAKEESGWCKIRDAVFLPGVINGALWAVEKTADRILSES